MAGPTELLQGTLDLLILKIISLEPLHGWGIIQRIRQHSQDAWEVGQGSPSPALKRRERRGLIRAGWGVPENNRRAKYYHLTFAGRDVLESEVDGWRRYVYAVELIVGLT
jgi:transcriptional regulator